MTGNTIKLSGVIITYNEERNIKRCLESLDGVCDEIVVVDSFSNDRTKEICQSFNVKFIEHKFEGHIEQKNYAMQSASNDHILSLDADEALSDQLKTEIIRVKANWKNDAYKFNRFTNYCGQWIKHSGWYPDTKVRLWDRRKGKWGGLNPHDSVELEDFVRPTQLNGDLLHYSYYTMKEHMERSIKYALISAYALQKRNKKAGFIKLVLNPAYRFIRDYFFNRGFMDGFYGLVISATNSYTTFLKYAYLRSLNNQKDIE